MHLLNQLKCFLIWLKDNQNDLLLVTFCWENQASMHSAQFRKSMRDSPWNVSCQCMWENVESVQIDVQPAISGNTAEMYQYGIQYWLAWTGSSLAFILSAVVFVPFFHELRMTSSFAVRLLLDDKIQCRSEGQNPQLTLSSLFVCTKV